MAPSPRLMRPKPRQCKADPWHHLDWRKAMSGFTASAATLALSIAACHPALAFDPGCFSGQAHGRAEERVAQSVVGIAIADPDAIGATFDTSGMGTGFAVAGSGDAGNPHLRIVTAYHVAVEAPGSGPGLVVLSSAGRIVARARVVARSRSGPSIGRVKHPGSDVAVLAVEPVEPYGGLAFYDTLPGIALAPTLPGAPVMVGAFADPSGIGQGDSGAPMVDSEGRAVAVITGYAPGDASRRATVAGGDLVGMNAAIARGQPDLVQGETSLDAENLGIAEDFTDPALLSALNGAAASARPDGAFPPGGRISVAVVGLPHGLCVVHRGMAAPDGQ
jgi:hypothetical protein